MIPDNGLAAALRTVLEDMEPIVRPWPDAVRLLRMAWDKTLLIDERAEPQYLPIIEWHLADIDALLSAVLRLLSGHPEVRAEAQRCADQIRAIPQKVLDAAAPKE